MGDRVRYERQSDRDEEARVAEALTAAWGCTVRKLPERYTLDYVAIRDGRVVAALEIKVRNRGLEEYGDVFINLNKVITAQAFNALGIKSLFVVQFTDVLAYADMTPPRRIEFRGREDRGDWQDVQPVVCIPNTDFKVIAATKVEA